MLIENKRGTSHFAGAALHSRPAVLVGLGDGVGASCFHFITKEPGLLR